MHFKLSTLQWQLYSSLNQAFEGRELPIQFGHDSGTLLIVGLSKCRVDERTSLFAFSFQSKTSYLFDVIIKFWKSHELGVSLIFLVV